MLLAGTRKSKITNRPIKLINTAMMTTKSPATDKQFIWARIMAFIIDIVILLCCYTAVMTLLAQLFRQTVFIDFYSLLNLSLFSLAVFLITPVFLVTNYFVIFHACGGQTVGKMLMGLRVIDRAGGNLSVGASFLRLTGYLLSALPLGAGFLWAVLDKDKEAWHDKLAFSQVIYEKKFLAREQYCQNPHGV